MHLPAGFLAGLGQRLEKILPIHVIQENVLAPISAAHDVIHRPGYSIRNVRGMAEPLPESDPNRQAKRTMLWFDPYSGNGSGRGN